MPKKVKLKKNLGGPARRLAWLLRNVWGDSQTLMAAAVGITQSAISHVITGRQQPGRSILAAIAKHPTVNGAWLLTGRGTPLVSELPGPAIRRRSLPLAECLLPGPPEKNRNMISGEMSLVPGALYPDGYYLYRASALPKEKIRDGDLLLIAAVNALLWGRDAMYLENKLCVVRDPVDCASLALRRVRLAPMADPDPAPDRCAHTPSLKSSSKQAFPDEAERLFREMAMARGPRKATPSGPTARARKSAPQRWNVDIDMICGVVLKKVSDV